jgi:hypothetical protein
MRCLAAGCGRDLRLGGRGGGGRRVRVRLAVERAGVPCTTARGWVRRSGPAPRSRLRAEHETSAECAGPGKTRLSSCGAGSRGSELATLGTGERTYVRVPSYRRATGQASHAVKGAGRPDLLHSMMGADRRRASLRLVLPEYLRHHSAERPHRAHGQLAPAQAHARPSQISLAEYRIRRKQVSRRTYTSATSPPDGSRLLLPDDAGHRPGGVRARDAERRRRRGSAVIAQEFAERRGGTAGRMARARSAAARIRDPGLRSSRPGTYRPARPGGTWPA